MTNSHHHTDDYDTFAFTIIICKQKNVKSIRQYCILKMLSTSNKQNNTTFGFIHFHVIKNMNLFY